MVAIGKGFAPELELELDFNRLSMENIPVELGADDSMIRTTLQYKILKTPRARIAAGGKIFSKPRLRFFPIGDDKKANDAQAALIGSFALFHNTKLLNIFAKIPTLFLGCYFCSEKRK